MSNGEISLVCTSGCITTLELTSLLFRCDFVESNSELRFVSTPTMFDLIIFGKHAYVPHKQTCIHARVSTTIRRDETF